MEPWFLQFLCYLALLFTHAPLHITIGDKVNELTGEILTIHQQQLEIFQDYDEIGPYLRQRAKAVPLATNEFQHDEVSK